MTSIGPIDALFKLGIVLIFAVIAIASKSLDRGGFLASVFVGYSILLGGGWAWFAVVAVFFVLGVGFTFFKYEYKSRLGSAQEKGGSRNWPNIMANGGVAAVLALAELAFGGSHYALMFLGAISAAAADTVATEVGLLSRSAPRLITELGRNVSHGTSGGVTVLGLLGSMLASFAIGLFAFILGTVGVGSRFVPAVIFVVMIGGVVGALGDSVLGATVQRKGYCVVCGKSSEATKHCGEKAIMTAGLGFMDNNIVNFLATVIGALVALGLALVVA